MLEVQPFANGGEHEAWIASQCAGCRRYDPDADGWDDRGCDLEIAFAMARIGSGKVPVGIAERAGIVVDGELQVPSPACIERDAAPASVSYDTKGGEANG